MEHVDITAAPKHHEHPYHPLLLPSPATSAPQHALQKVGGAESGPLRPTGRRVRTQISSKVSTGIHMLSGHLLKPLIARVQILALRLGFYRLRASYLIHSAVFLTVKW